MSRHFTVGFVRGTNLIQCLQSPHALAYCDRVELIDSARAAETKRHDVPADDMCADRGGVQGRGDVSLLVVRRWVLGNWTFVFGYVDAVHGIAFKATVNLLAQVLWRCRRQQLQTVFCGVTYFFLACSAGRRQGLASSVVAKLGGQVVGCVECR